jgi:nucleotide-binding universal stress UspA family protein
MQKADYLLRLMKQRTDALLAKDEKLQQFLLWLSHKPFAVEVSYKPAAVRAFYFALDRALDRALVRVLDPALDRALDLALDLALIRALDPTLDLALDLTLDRALERNLDPVLDLALDLALVRVLDPALDPTLFRALNSALDLEPELKKALQELKAQLSHPPATSTEASVTSYRHTFRISRRSIRVSPDCISLVKQALKNKGFPSVGALAVNLGLSRSTVMAFFSGRPVDHSYFVEISELLGLDWTAIAEREVVEHHTGETQENGLGIDALPLALDCALNPELQDTLQQLKEQRPDLDRKTERLKVWWQANGQNWIEQLRAVMIKHRNIGYDWQFSNQQKQLLNQYYEANKLLVDCLNSDSNVTPSVRSHIEETLLLPIAEIEKRGSCRDK